MSLLIFIAAGLRSPAPTHVDHVYKKARLVSWLVSVYFLIVHFTSLTHAST